MLIIFRVNPLPLISPWVYPIPIHTLHVKQYSPHLCLPLASWSNGCLQNNAHIITMKLPHFKHAQIGFCPHMDTHDSLRCNKKNLNATTMDRPSGMTHILLAVDPRKAFDTDAAIVEEMYILYTGCQIYNYITLHHKLCWESHPGNQIWQPFSNLIWQLCTTRSNHFVFVYCCKSWSLQFPKGVAFSLPCTLVTSPCPLCS